MLAKTLLIGRGTCCVSAGAEQIHHALVKELTQLGLADKVQVKGTGCRGFSEIDPVVTVEPEGLLYCRVKIEDTPEIARSLLPEGKPVEGLFYYDPVIGKPISHYRDITFYNKQQRTQRFRNFHKNTKICLQKANLCFE
ncbi:(2Fe-2S) ferredoxin domain-containing protein [Candidatus Hakubella thermalkaliphila]|uniref:NADP-reducing hydrogenase subunit HndC n=1 Tax=Candidatus Hakubella thermalkaliphila TaxID=2754717 RepID=A0A6V8PGL4_9ACTN|nr:(2Fe-2S) ferredoxin domain-containing protein [Candidatus Hakubella thermalkaliphila]GFP31260.1 NADP-reducing hydrogenase subunit HndC [Candidatus Hakubella thermalkaliphila]